MFGGMKEDSDSEQGEESQHVELYTTQILSFISSLLRLKLKGKSLEGIKLERHLEQLELRDSHFHVSFRSIFSPVLEIWLH